LDALEEVIQLVWTTQTLPIVSSVQIGDKFDCTNYQGICPLNIAHKVFAKVLYDRLLPNANAVVQHYEAGFQPGKSTTDKLFALRQIL
jgi:hypothetical protein